MKETINAFVKLYLSDEISYLEKETHKSILNIDFEELDSFLYSHLGKHFFESQYRGIMKRLENLINSKTDESNHITPKLKDMPCNILLKNLDADNNLEIISTKAMIKNITDTKVIPSKVCYVCSGCMKSHYIDVEGNIIPMPPQICNECGSKKFYFDENSSEYKNIRYVKLEEPLELRDNGATREFKGYMEGVLASPYHKLKAGDVCNIIGKFEVRKVNNRNTKQDYEFLINLHNITPVDDEFADNRITEKDIDEILKLSDDPNIFQKLVNTLAPSVYGYEMIKKGLLLQLFEGARPLEEEGSVYNHERWTIHTLLIGDPGIGKSQLVESINKSAPKCISIAGTGTSQAGITTTAVKDELTGTWAMEAGAVVLADTGLLTIDEYDKLSKKTQKALNEPMEQMNISSAKAGLVQTMSARTSILAVANPIHGRFNKFNGIYQELDIPDSNLSRFDLVFALEDKIDEEKDTELARALLTRDFGIDEKDIIPSDIFKKYINYAKSNVFPVMSKEANELLVKFFVNARQSAKEDADSKPITSRDLVGLKRLCIARAKSELREYVTINDALEVISIYEFALNSIGLSVETVGELYGVLSDNELEMINDCEEEIRKMSERFGLPLPSEVRERIITNLGCDESVFKEALKNVEKTI